MPYLPTIPDVNRALQVTDVFLGYNHNMKTGDGELYDMENLTSDYFPLLANRKSRGRVKSLTSPRALLGKAKLAYIDGAELYYGEEAITGYLNARGFYISEAAAMLPKKLISMGAYIVIYPDKLYINTENYTDCGGIEARFSSIEGETVTYTMCQRDGSAMENAVLSTTPPENPQSGGLWIDASGQTHVLNRFNGGSGMWTPVQEVYTKISCPGIGRGFEKLDGVTLSGCRGGEGDAAGQLNDLNGSKIIYGRGEDYIVVTGLIDSACTQNTGAVTVSREMPDLDFITESENRLWGCKYGLVDGRTVNEIYACALGDFKNWNQFLGLSTDSYIASVGTDGEWTGAACHLGYPIFFKESCLHKVYISSSGAHRIVDTACRGVERGSGDSLAIVNETLFYKSGSGICAYDGSLPVSVSGPFGMARYSNASSGSLGDKYYISMKDDLDKYHMFVFDTSRGLWHREDNTHAVSFARWGGELYYIDGDTKSLMAETGGIGEPEGKLSWRAETGLMGYDLTCRKYISRFNIRMKLPPGSFADVFVQYDSDGVWRCSGHIDGTGTKTFMLPVRPRRCDHFRVKLEGAGDVRIYSFARILEGGSDV